MGCTRTQGQPDRSLPELIFEVVSAALVDAGQAMADVDGIVIAAHDLVDGRSLSSMITGPAAGAYLRDEIRVADDGLVALALGAARIESGEARCVVVASWGRASEGERQDLSRVAFDPFVEQPFGLTEGMVSGLRTSAYLRQHGGAGRADAAAARQGRAGTMTGPGVETAVVPLHAGDVAPAADVVAAVVLASRSSAVVIRGIGQGTDPARLGDRDLADLQAARAAATHAFAQAQVGPGDLHCVELHGLTLVDEVLLLEGLGLSDAGEGFQRFTAMPWVNATGGSAAGGQYPCGGLLSFVAAVTQLRGDAGRGQILPRPVFGLVASGSAVAMQTVTAVVVESR